MSVIKPLNRKTIALFFVALSLLGLVFLGLQYRASASGTSFDHIVILAMENQNYADVLGDGSSTGCLSGSNSVSFLCSMLLLSSTIPNYHSYCSGSSDPACSGGNTGGNPPCSYACYTLATSGLSFANAPSDGAGTAVGSPNIFDSLTNAGLSWSEYCENGCPRGADHSPCLQYTDTANSPNCNVLSGALIGNSQVLTTTSNYVWITPTDSHNMHDNSISSGDAWLQSFLVGSGSLSSPASGSLLASSLFTNTSFHTLLWIWWDEYDPSPNIEYGSMVKKGFVSQSNSWDHYSLLRMVENNWGLPTLSLDAQAPVITDIFGTITPPGLSASFTYSPTAPVAGSSVAFRGVASGGVSPYSYAWNYGDGSTGTGITPSHTYTSSGNYSVTLSVNDSASHNAKSSQTVRVAPMPPLSATISTSPMIPTSGQNVTFSASSSGGTSPYRYSWNLGGTTKIGNPVAKTFTNGTYSITLTVSDSSGKTASATQSLIVLPSSNSGPAPKLIGWGGVGIGERLSDIQSEMQLFNQSGYNTVRLDFEPTCTTPPDSGILGSYDQTKLGQVIALAKQYKLWIIIDYHGYLDLETSSTQGCWLGFWNSLVQNFTSTYSQIIWEPINEPQMNSSTDVAGLSSAYQSVINEIRAQGDTHWIVVQNLCSSICGFGDTNMAAGYPTVTDPTGHIFISLHSYMPYQYSSSSWNNATADTLAQEFLTAVTTGMKNTGWPALNTEGGADPINGNCSLGVILPSSLCAPDQVLVGAAGYSVTTFHFIQTLTNLYDNNSPQRINWIWWPAGSWPDTPGAGTYGAMQCNSNPIGWGCLLRFQPLGPPASGFDISTDRPGTVDVGQSTTITITITALNGFTGTVGLAYLTPNGLSCGTLSKTSITGSGTSTVTCSAPAAGSYTLIVTGTSGAISTTATTTFNFQDFSLSASPSSITTNIGTQTTSAIGLNVLNGFGSQVNLTLSAPSGISASLSNLAITGSQTSTLTITPNTAGSYSIAIVGASGPLTRTITATVIVGTQIPPTVNAPSTRTVVQTRTLTFIVTSESASTSTNLILSANQVPSDASFQTAQGTSPVYGTFTWTPTTSDAPGTYTISFTADDGVSTAQTYVIVTVVPSTVLPIITLSGSQNATVGKTLHFAVLASDQSGLGGTVTLSSTGLAPDMAFNPENGTFSFTPSSSQAGQTFNVIFIATDSNDASWNNSRTIPIYVMPAAATPPGGGFCLSCLLPKDITTLAWLLGIGALIGIVSAIGLLHIRASLQLAATRRRVQSLNKPTSSSPRAKTNANSRRVVQRYREDERESSSN